MDALPAVAVFGGLFAVGALIEYYRFRSRRKYVEAYLAERSMTLIACRYYFDLVGANWLTKYRVRVRDRSAHELSGIASATGWLRRKAWVDWD